MQLPPDPRLSAERLGRLEERLGYAFRDPRLLAQALCHSSSRPDGLPSNERLEFLGDSVLNLLTAMYLFNAHPHLDEGELTKRRARAVSCPALVKAGECLELASFLAVGRGMEGQGPLSKAVVADAMEALVGAVFLDGGLESAWAFVVGHFFRFLRPEPAGAGESSPKSRLQVLAQRLRRGPAPVYELVEEEGPPHARTFQVAVAVGGRRFGPAAGRTRKEAETEAARLALAALAEEADEGGA